MADHGDYREEFHGEHPLSYDHTEPKYRNVWLILGATTVFLIFTGIVIQTWVNGLWEGLTYDKVLSQENIQLETLRERERTELTTWGVADAQTGGYRMPIDQAMKAVIAESGSPKYPTAPYAVKSAAELAGDPTGAAPSGAAAVNNNTQNQGGSINPNVHQQPVAQQPNK